MIKKIFGRCNSKCKYELNGYKLENIDLSEVLTSGTYILGKDITDNEKTGDIPVETEGSVLIVNRNDKYASSFGINQVVINGTTVFSRLAYVDKETNNFSNCTEWKNMDLLAFLSWDSVFIDISEPDYIDGAIWFKPIE